MTTLTIALPDASMLRLKELANEAGVDPEELLNASVVEWLADRRTISRKRRPMS